MVSKELARCLARISGDGNASKHYLRYNNKSKELREAFTKDLLTIFPKIHITKGTSNTGTKFIQSGRKEVLNLFFSYLNDFRSDHIHIPSKILNSKIAIKKEYLAAFFTDEGSVPLRLNHQTMAWKRSLTYTSNSLRILKEIKEILLDLGIKSNSIIRNRSNSNRDMSYVLAISGKKNIFRFRSLFDLDCSKKSRRLDLMCLSYSAQFTKNKKLFWKIYEEIYKNKMRQRT